MVKTLLNYLTYLPRSLAYTMVGIALAALPLRSFAAPEVRLESNTGVLNVSAGEKLPYKDSTSAKVDEVVKIQVWYHNMEDPNSEKIADNLRMKIDLPNKPGKQQVVTSTVSADNANTVTDSAIVNLSLDHAFLEYIPGSAEFRYNKQAKNGNKDCQTELKEAPASCYVTEAISDAVVTSNNGVVLEEENFPCFAYEATVTVLARVKAPVVTVNKTVRHAGDDSDAWTTRLTDVKPGEELEYQIRFENKGNTVLKDVIVGDDLPKYHSYVEGSTKLKNTNYPNGTNVESDNLTRGGINVGSYNPGSVGYILFTAKIDEVNVYEKCGNYEVANRAAVRPEGMNEFENWARVVINVDTCDEPEGPIFACDSLTGNDMKLVNIKPGQTVDFETEYTADNISADDYSVLFMYDFGDGKTITTDQPTTSHTYSKKGTHTATVKVVFVPLEGDRAEETSQNCRVTVTVSEKPPVTPPEAKLPSTGPAETLMAVTGTGALGQAIRAYLGSRKKLLGALLSR